MAHEYQEAVVLEDYEVNLTTHVSVLHFLPNTYSYEPKVNKNNDAVGENGANHPALFHDKPHFFMNL